jgi:hypothetical protein
LAPANSTPALFFALAWKYLRIPVGVLIGALLLWLAERALVRLTPSKGWRSLKIAFVGWLSMVLSIAWYCWKPGAAETYECLRRSLFNLESIVGFVAILLAVSGIAYDVRHEEELEGQTNKLGDQLEKLEVISEQLSTRRLGPFPGYVKTIANLASESSELRILADCVDYGSFFAPPHHQRFFDALCKLGQMARIIVAGAPAGFTKNSQMNSENFPKDYETIIRQWWPAYLKQITNDESFVRWIQGAASPGNGQDAFFQWYSDFAHKGVQREEFVASLQRASAICGEGDLKDTDASPFNVLLQARQFWFAYRLWDKKVEIYFANDLPSPPLFLWIAESNNADPKTGTVEGTALFAFSDPHRGERDDMLGFGTIDAHLVRTFRGIFDKQISGLKKWDPTADVRRQDAARSAPPNETPPRRMA